MEKKTFFTITSNGDLNLTTHSLEECLSLIKDDLDGCETNQEKEEMEYTIQPNLMTQEEFESMPEYEG